MAIVLGVLSVILVVAGGIFWALTAISWTTALAVYFVGTCVLLVLVVLMQKPKGGGLAGAFGGAGGGGQQAMFGAKAGDMFTLITVCLFLLFLLLGMGLVYSTRIDYSMVDELPPPKPNAVPKKQQQKQKPEQKQTPGPVIPDPEEGLKDITGKEAPKTKGPAKPDGADQPKTDGDDGAAKKDEPKKEDATKAPPKGADR